MNYIFTTVYPASKKYFKEFIESINSQTSKNFKLFIILNGTKLSKTHTNLINVRFMILEGSKKKISQVFIILKEVLEVIIFWPMTIK